MDSTIHQAISIVVTPALHFIYDTHIPLFDTVPSRTSRKSNKDFAALHIGQSDCLKHVERVQREPHCRYTTASTRSDRKLYRSSQSRWRYDSAPYCVSRSDHALRWYESRCTSSSASPIWFRRWYGNRYIHPHRSMS